MTLSATERQMLDRIEVSLLASDPTLARTLDMIAVRRRLVRRRQAARRGQRLGLVIGLAGLGAGAAGTQSVIGAVLAVGGAMLFGGAARTARRLRASLPTEVRTKNDWNAHTGVPGRLSGA